MDTHKLIKFDNTADLADWYDKKYIEMGGGWQIPREEAVRLIEWAEIDVEPTKSLLDVGCGHGYFTNFADEYVMATGIDISKTIITYARATFPETQFIKLDIEATLWPDHMFDYITSIGSIEHCINLDSALVECYRLLKNDGKFLVLVPNEQWQHFDQPQETTFTDYEWSRLFDACGFKVIKQNRRQDLTDFLLIKKTYANRQPKTY